MAKSPVAGKLARLAAEVGAVDGPAATAEVLVALAYDTRDREVWGGDRALSFWDRFPDRVRSACYAGPSLAAWWERMARVLGCGQPGLAADRVALAAALACGDDRAVLDVLRTQPEAMCLRARLANQIDRDAAAPNDDTPAGPGANQEAML